MATQEEGVAYLAQQRIEGEIPRGTCEKMQGRLAEHSLEHLIAGPKPMEIGCGDESVMVSAPRWDKLLLLTIDNLEDFQYCFKPVDRVIFMNGIIAIPSFMTAALTHTGLIDSKVL